MYTATHTNIYEVKVRTRTCHSMIITIKYNNIVPTFCRFSLRYNNIEIISDMLLTLMVTVMSHIVSAATIRTTEIVTATLIK